MTTKELIEILSIYPPDTEVYVDYDRYETQEPKFDFVLEYVSSKHEIINCCLVHYAS